MSLEDDREMCELCKWHCRCHADADGYLPCEQWLKKERELEDTEEDEE